MVIVFLIMGIAALYYTLKQESELKDPSKFIHLRLYVTDVTTRRVARTRNGKTNYVEERVYAVKYELNDRWITEKLVGNQYYVGRDKDNNEPVIDLYFGRHDPRIVKQRAEPMLFVMYGLLFITGILALVI